MLKMFLLVVGVILTFGLIKTVVYDSALVPEHLSINFKSRFHTYTFIYTTYLHLLA